MIYGNHLSFSIVQEYHLTTLIVTAVTDGYPGNYMQYLWLCTLARALQVKGNVLQRQSVAVLLQTQLRRRNLYVSVCNSAEADINAIAF